MNFEWNHTKAKINAKKHDVSFDEASTCFYDPHQISFYDPDNSDENNEHREILLGYSEKGRLIVISYTLREGVIRIISARLAIKREKIYYAQRI